MGKSESKSDLKKAAEKRKAPLATPSDLGDNAVRDLTGALNETLADVFALYFKTKNFHWHVSGPHFRDYHLMLDEQAGELLALTDVIAERARKLGGTTLRSVGHIGRLQRVEDNDADYVSPSDMIAELRDDNKDMVGHFRGLKELADEHRDFATSALVDTWIDEAEKRHWFLFEVSRQTGP
ncbi:DNA starvation/stationary phase protection protein [Hyphomicrobium sp.]|uniref:Dps family protein n=1 Tax=Hyphomicrobium sp. TaxID=82 RepID=UPI002C54587D|nr:DNA starvation/stationary phase protection protein [Hyphomicrobium sp.]HRN89216.1 DNA starvation/stationary phase protection protein [Hyphomicrobium sp.]HRQ26108.1 DNA starvation/stationary phase protection protein [Hyphomicrobium sp.]